MRGLKNKAIIGVKVGMTQVFDENGKLIPVTVIHSEPMKITQIKTVENDGYEAVQVAGGRVKKLPNKPQQGHYEKAGVEPRKVLKEILAYSKEANIGDTIDVSIFEKGEIIDAVAKSKGKGTQGAIKRHNQSRGPMAHGSKYHRGAGSLGASATPSRVFKGQKGAGKMGSERVTVQNLSVVDIDAENNLILIKGAVPGPKKGTVILRSAVKQG